jgi:hypothetical protein
MAYYYVYDPDRRSESTLLSLVPAAARLSWKKTDRKKIKNVGVFK